MTSGVAAIGRDFAAGQPADHAFLGHPKGLAVLAFSEGWERLSYSGMQTLFALYTMHVLFQPHNIGKIWFFTRFLSGLEAIYGTMLPVALASSVFGLYAGFVYLTPLLGGLLADRLIGKTNTVVIGALLLTAGHFLMGFEQSFLIALLCLVLGIGCFKTDITGQVGDLYARDDTRRANAFQIFVLAIAIAAVAAPLVCGTLGERMSWSWGFDAAGIGMVVGLLAYLGGRRWLPLEPPRRRHGFAEPRPKLTPGEGRVIAVLVCLLPVLAVASIGNKQMFNAYPLWGEANYRLVFFGQAMPVTWLISIDSIIAIAAMIGSLAF